MSVTIRACSGSGSPWENGSIESHHSRERDEFLERDEFESAEDARAKVAWYRWEQNTVPRHRTLNEAKPKEFSAGCDERTEAHRIHMLLYMILSLVSDESHLRRTPKRGHTTIDHFLWSDQRLCAIAMLEGLAGIDPEPPSVPPG